MKMIVISILKLFTYALTKCYIRDIIVQIVIIPPCSNANEYTNSQARYLS